MTKIALGGDFTLISENCHFNFDAIQINNSLSELDFFSVNLETPILNLSDKNISKKKSGYIQSGSEKSIQILNKLNKPLSNKYMLKKYWQEVSVQRYLNEWSQRFGWSETSLSWPLKEFIKRLLYKSFKDFFEKRILKRLSNRELIFSNPAELESIHTALGVLSKLDQDSRDDESKKIVKELAPGIYWKN